MGAKEPAMGIILFEDARVTQLYPVTLSKPACHIQCGGYRLFDLVRSFVGSVRAVLRAYLQASYEADFGPTTADAAVMDSENRSPILLVNARVVPSIAAARRLRRLF